MPKMKANVAELKDAQVSFVSLVKRGANRIPIRIQKSTNQESSGMSLDLSNLKSMLFRSSQKAEAAAAPQVTALILPSKGEDFEHVKATIKAAGYNVDKVTEVADGTVIFAQVDNPQEGADVFKLSDNLAVVAKGFRPYSESLTSFKEQAAANGFWAGMNVACDTFTSVVSKALWEADSPEAAAEAVKKTVKELGDYMVALASALPTNAFKLDKSLGDAVAVAKAAAAEKVKVTVKAEPVPVAVPALAAAVVAAAAETPAAPTLDEIVQKTAALVSSSLKTDLDKITGLITTLDAAQKAQATELASLSQKSEAVSKTLTSTVVSATPAKDAPTQAVAVKGDDDGDLRVGQFDTAFLPNRGRPTKR